MDREARHGETLSDVLFSYSSKMMRVRVISCCVGLTLLVGLNTAFAEGPAQLRPLDEQDEPTRALVQKVVEGYGGENALRRMTSVERIARIDETTAEGPRSLDVLSIYFFPSNYWMKVRSTKGDSTAVALDGSGHVLKADSDVKGAAMKMAPEEVQSFYRFIFEDPLMVLQNRIRPSLLFANGGTAKFADRDCDVLRVEARGIEMSWYVDHDSGHVLRNVVGENTHDFSEWRTVEGITLPFTQINNHGGVVTQVTYKDFKLHPPTNQELLFRAPTMWLSRFPYYGSTQRSAYTIYFVNIDWK
jgi:hypothetical protein